MIADLHVHTRLSSDSNVAPEQYLEFAKSSERGLGAICFTEHRLFPDDAEVGAPDASEPVHTEPREAALREALNEQGYGSVHFKMDGDTIILWGSVPTEADRLMVQTQIFLVARIFSIEDHIQVRDTFAEP